MDFEWDDLKAEKNFKKHGVRFSEAVTTWYDSNALEMLDPYSENEERWIRLGMSLLGCLMVVIYTERNDKIRIISARKATRNEITQYRW